MLYDCFYFCDELDILEIRFNELHDVVDKFIFFEVDKYFGDGSEKDFIFEKNQDRFKKYKDKIIYYKLSFDKKEIHSYSLFENTFDNFIRDFASSTIVDDDIIIVSCVNEIWKKVVFKKFTERNEISQLEMVRFDHYYNGKCGYSYGPRALKFKDYTNIHEIRKTFFEPSFDQKIIPNAGWHFEYILQSEQFDDIKEYINKYHYADYWSEENLLKINTNLNNKINAYNEPINFVFISKDNLPEFIIENKKIFKTELYIDFSVEVYKLFSDVSNQEKDLIQSVVLSSGNEAKFVKIGDLSGKSTAFLSAMTKDKNVSIDVIDDWKRKSQYSLSIMKQIEVDNKSCYKIFLENISPIADDNINILKINPNKQIVFYKDNSLDFIFIDYDQDDEYIANAIRLWLPKLKPGGTISGIVVDDLNLNFNKEFPGLSVLIEDNIWVHKKNVIEICCELVKNENQLFFDICLFIDLRNKDINFNELNKYIENIKVNNDLNLKFIFISYKKLDIEFDNSIFVILKKDYYISQIFEYLFNEKLINSKYYKFLIYPNTLCDSILLSSFNIIQSSNKSVLLGKFKQEDLIFPIDKDIFSHWDGRMEYLIDYILNSEIIDFPVEVYLFSSDLKVDHKYDEFIMFDNEYEQLIKNILISVSPFEILYTGVPYVKII